MSTINATASHIFRLLGWLTEAPLTVEQINEKFEQTIGRKLSSDSIWLYLNTLRALGCQISRPTPTNGFQHELLYNAFSVHLTDSDLRSLIETKSNLELHNATYQEHLAFDRFVKILLANSSFLPEPTLPSAGQLGSAHMFASSTSLHLPDDEFSLYQAAQSGRLLQDEYFTKTRSVDYDPHLSMVQTLEQAILTQTGIIVSYRSKRGYPISKFEINPPERLAYRHGILYLVSPANNTTVLTPWHGKSTQEDLWLRVERIEQISLLGNHDHLVIWQPVTWTSEDLDEQNTPFGTEFIPPQFDEDLCDYEIYEVDLTQAMDDTNINSEKTIVRYKKADASKLQPFHMREARESMKWREIDNEWYLDVVFQTSDLFTLKQNLLEQGLPFKIISPDFFREDMVQLIDAMAQSYQAR
ncbi:MAG: WYL domain-containing protein [Vampirovibrionales bacterium]|nr:WYL domain-containing protein [Vampirovibrionales bacterium]